ncbi:MAG: adenine specific DNA methylase [Candidatus Scalindua rubra]|uniref:Methyltransferase n=1 Tax=Candidatus Scalindua rubra TaxID=1872076 RepID=A0A1E3X415_9BACT|nr:MAG: adenine specific DNA methylase [Candidatus Scalindua rubra]
MKEHHDEGRIYYTRNGTAEYIRYLDEMPSVPLQDVWHDISPINPQAKERLGYPTQKLLALLERIIVASSNEGDVVLDPFCGCGTALDAAEGLKRKWIGIDITPIAVALIEKRLKDGYRSRLSPYEVHGFPTTIESAHELAKRSRYEFQDWVIEYLLGGVSNETKVGDGGFDGHAA